MISPKLTWFEESEDMTSSVGSLMSSELAFRVALSLSTGVVGSAATFGSIASGLLLNSLETFEEVGSQVDECTV